MNRNSKKNQNYYNQMKNNIKINKRGIIAKFLMGLVITFFLSTVISYWSYSNLFFAIPTYIKMLILVGTLILITNITCDKPETALYWKDPEKRAMILNIKMKQSFFETIVIFIVNFIILVFTPITGALNFLYENESNIRFISYYQPTFLEAVLITIIIILSFIAIWTSMYWFAGRFLQIKEYSNRLKRFVLKTSSVYICLMILLLIFWGAFYIGDFLFREVKIDGNFRDMEFLKDFTQRYYLWILTGEIFILLGINLLFYFNGDKNLRERDNFILLDKEKSEIKRKKERDQKIERKKDFKTAIFEILIISSILIPLFFMFMFIFLSNGLLIFLFISVGFLIFNSILGMYLGNGKFSIIKLKSSKGIEN